MISTKNRKIENNNLLKIREKEVEYNKIAKKFFKSKKEKNYLKDRT